MCSRYPLWLVPMAINWEIQHSRRIHIVLRCLPYHFFLLAFVCSWLPFLADMMDCGEHPREDVPEASGLPPRL